MNAEATIAIAAVITTGIVGLAGVVVPAVLRNGDRKHERRTKIREDRASAYSSVLGVMHDMQDLSASGDVSERTREPSIQIWLWGSTEVRALFTAWVKIMHTQYGPAATAEDKERVRLAANAVRQRMSDELQGRVTLD